MLLIIGGTIGARGLLMAMLALFLFIAPVSGQERGPLTAHLKDPVFLKNPEAAPASVAGRDALTLNFSYDYDRCRAEYGDQRAYSGCERRLDLDGRKAEKGIGITPAIAGSWRWNGDYSLSFTPSEYWRAGEDYSIGLDLDALGVPEAVVVGADRRKIDSAVSAQPLSVAFKDMKYMQDPDDPARKIVTARLEMNYPVAPAALASKLKVSMEEEAGGTMKTVRGRPGYEIRHAADGISAIFTATLKTLPDRERYLVVAVDPGLTPLHGGEPSPAGYSERARIPDLKTYLTIDNSAALIARAEDGAPKQVLSLVTNTKAKPKDVLANVRMYLLPAQHPVTKRSGKKQDELYKWEADSEVTPEILKLSTPVALQPMEAPEKDTTAFEFTFDAPPGRYLFLSVGKGMQAFGGYVLGRDYGAILQAPAWPTDIEIMQKGSILTLSGARKISLHARGTDRLTLDIAHIRTAALQHFISQTEGDIRKPSFQNWNFGREDIAEIDSKTVPMNYQSAGASQYAAFDFSPYLKDGKKGLFLVGVQGFRDGKPLNDPEQRFVLVTDMGLLVKVNGNGGRDVYLMSFTGGQPVAGAAVAVLGRNGLPVFGGKTDGEGHIALPDFGSLSGDKQPVAVTAQKDGDFTFIPYARDDRFLNMSQFDIGGAVTAAKGMNAFLFSDRGIYRPGETAHIGLIVRNADWTALPPGLPLQMIVKDARGRVVRDEILKIPAEGLDQTELATGEDWATGTYRASLHIPEDGQPGNMLGSTSFRVEDFQPDRLKIKTAFSKDSAGWVQPAGLEATVTLLNLYGTPATGRRITGAVTLSPAALSFAPYKEYQFYDSRAAKPRTIEYDLPDAVTDDAGQAVLKLNLEAQEAASYSLNLQSKGFEAGSGRGVSAYSSVMVSPMDYAIGFKSAARLDYLRKGQAYAVSLIAVDPALSPRAVQGLTRILIRKTFVATLVKHEDGSYAYESVPREETVASEPFAIAAGGSDLALPSGAVGSFAWRVKDQNGTVVAEIPFAVAGEGERAAGADREAMLGVKIDKALYAPGESIELNINAPYAGAGLITLESDHVLAHRWFRTDKTDSVQSIAIPKDFSGKGYVSVAFVRDINSREIYMSPLSYATVPFTANTEARTVQITLDVPDKVKPGEAVTVGYSANIKGKAIIYAVDEGILQVARYKTPDPVGFFLLNRALQVQTAQMLDLLMPEYDLMRALSAKGGDGSEGASLGQYVNPFKRRSLAPAVFWSGIVELGQDEKTVTFTPPGHFNGQMRVMAVAVSDAGIGSAEKPVTVQGDLVVTPNVPVFMAPGDEAEASITIANNLPGSGKAELSVDISGTPGIAFPQKPSDKIIVPQGQEKTVTFKIKATDNPGPASVTVEAGTGATTVKAEATLSVRPASPSETTMTAGYAEKGSASVKLARTLYPAFAERTLALSALPTSYIFGLLRYLDEYPYGCTEQTVSKAFPQIALAGEPAFGVSVETMKSKAASAITDLRLRQTSEGGFSLWDGGDQSDDFATVYTLDFLVRAREAGLAVPSETIEEGLRYLREWINQDVKSMDDARMKAYGIYVLTGGGIVTTNEILHLLKYFDDRQQAAWKTDLTAVYIAAAYKMMQQTDQAAGVMDRFEAGMSAEDLSYKGSDWLSPWYNPFIKYARYITVTARHFPDRMKAMDKQAVFRLAAFIRDQQYSTLSAAYAIQALEDYARTENADMAGRQFKAEADGQALPLQGAGPVQADIPVAASAVRIDDSGKPVFYTVSETGYDRNIPSEPVAQGMEIDRAYLDKDGKPLVGPVALGDTVEAVVTVRSHDSRAIDNVAMVDLLPGGFELEQEDGQSENTTADFVDRREDRIIIFDTVTPDERTYRYRMRATAKGQFTVPPPFAQAMYELTSKARGRAGGIAVVDPK